MPTLGESCEVCFYSVEADGILNLRCCKNAPQAGLQGTHNWPIVAADMWCGEFEPVGGTLTESYIAGNAALTTTARVKLMDVGGDTTFTVAAMFGCQITNLANQAVVVFFHDGDTAKMIAQAGSVANGSNEVSFSYPPVARSGEIWCALSAALNTIYVSAQGRKVRA